ncbi:MAG: hypothetical protein ACM3SQ_05125 [Betaproteobacteria bacterium]
MRCDDRSRLRREVPRAHATAWWALLIVLLFPSQLLAVPAFARRYETSCATCHQAFPRLNAVGESFRLAGFRFVDDERYRKINPVELGDEAYKKLWPHALWPTDVPRTSPLSFVARMMGEVDLDGTRRTDVTFLLPEETELVWVANLGEDIAFYGDGIFLQKDFGGLKADSWATFKGWMQFQSVVGQNKLNLRVGTVGTQTMGLFTARDANFYGTHYYLYTSWLMPTPNAAAAGFTQFKGNNFSIGPQAGVEANGFGERWFYAGGVVNGDLISPVTGPPESDIEFVGMGTGGGRDVYMQLAYKAGGVPFDRSRERPAETLTSGAEFWRDDSTILSFFGYRGHAMIRAVAADGTVHEDDDLFWRLGASVQHEYRDITLGAVWVEGNNARPYGVLSREPVRSRAWHLETIYFAYPWLLPYARYESLSLDVPAGIPGVSPDQDIARLMVGAKAMIRPNVWVVGETAFYTKGAELEEGFDRTLFVLLAVSF